MKLAELIRKRGAATATVATFATVAPKNTPSVASVASVAVANPKADITYWMWQVTLPDRTFIVTTTPPSTMSEMVETYPDAISIEVIE